MRRLGFYQPLRLEGKGGTNICTKAWGCSDAGLTGGSVPRRIPESLGDHSGYLLPGMPADDGAGVAPGSGALGPGSQPA